MKDKLRVLVVGCGNMGRSHARAYHKIKDFQIVGLVSRGAESREALSKELGGYPCFGSFDQALKETDPDVVSINTYPDTHAEYVQKSLEADAHVFVEKPLANTVEEAQALVDLAKARNKKMVIGYILRVHPAWAQFIDISRTLGKPLVMRMNLNQQSSGHTWETHKQLMQSMSPIVDCGVHYVDVMCLPGMYNYGQLQVTFDDGSVGWYEAGWGPMMSETAFFIKDVIGPNGCVSIIDSDKEDSDDVDGHTQTGGLLLHHSERLEDGSFAKKDELHSTKGEPNHDELCHLEQEFLLRAIQEDQDLGDHMRDAVNSLKVVLAADQAFKTGEVVHLNQQ